uniref:Uncharacterized protein n=1 Tax=Timema tahoe TaxID=61484 RepID=A0A7R9FJF3_9NEOP|nr:unnamed protein product [Timema tahoe]
MRFVCFNNVIDVLHGSKKIWVEKFNNGVDGRVFRTTDLLTFSPNPDDQDNIFSTAKTFELTEVFRSRYQWTSAEEKAEQLTKLLDNNQQFISSEG